VYAHNNRGSKLLDSFAWSKHQGCSQGGANGVAVPEHQSPRGRQMSDKMDILFFSI
jgi:hypothetical protein